MMYFALFAPANKMKTPNRYIKHIKGEGPINAYLRPQLNNFKTADKTKNRSNKPYLPRRNDSSQ